MGVSLCWSVWRAAILPPLFMRDKLRADQVLLLTRPPTRIAEIVPFGAERPRHPETLTSNEFVGAKARCLEVFQREVRKK